MFLRSAQITLSFFFLYVNTAHSDLDIFSYTFVSRLQLVRTVGGLYNEIHIWPILGHIGLSAHNCDKTSTVLMSQAVESICSLGLQSCVVPRDP